MSFQLPPIFFHAVGFMLILFGALRAYQLGWKRRQVEPDVEPQVEADGDADLDAAGAAEARAELQRRTGYTAKRHMVWGLIWIVLGLFLVVSTLLNSRV